MDSKNIFTNKYLVPLLAILACILWGTAFPSLKISYEELNVSVNDYFTKMLFASYRFFTASLFLFAWRYITSRKKPLKKIFKVNKKELKFLFFLGLMQTTLQYFFFYNGLANTTGVKGSILTTLGIFFTVIASHFLYKNDKLSSRKAFGLVLGFLGVIIVNLSKGSFDFYFKFTGEGFIIMSAVTSTIAAIMVKNASGKIEPLLITAYQMLIGSIILFLMAIIKVGPLSLEFSVKTFLILQYLAFVSAAGFSLWYSLIKYNRLGYVTIYKFVVPVSGVLFSSLLLVEERVTINIFIALLLVSMGIIMINYRPKRKKIRQGMS